MLIDQRRASRRFRFKLDNLLGALASIAYAGAGECPIEYVQALERWLQQQGGIELRRTVLAWLQARLPDGESTLTLESSQLVQGEGTDMAGFRNGMPLFPTFAQQFAWGYEQSGKQ